MGRGGHNGLYTVTAMVSAVNGPACATETITCTPEHPLFVQGQGWVEAGSVGIGSSIVSRAGPALQVTGLTWEKNKAEELAAGTGSSFGGYTVYNMTVEGDHTFFVGSANGGTWVHNVCHRKVFFDNFSVPTAEQRNWWVHHAIPQKVFQDFPGLFPAALKDDISNLRGINSAVNRDVHLKDVGTLWSRFFANNPNPTAQSILRQRDLIDRIFASHFHW